MSLMQMLNFYELVIFLCLTSVVTSTFTSDTARADDINHDFSALNKHVSLAKSNQSSTVRPLHSLNISSTANMDNVPFVGEGGPIDIKNKSMGSMDEHDPLKESFSTETHNTMVQFNNNRTEVKTKIVPRKGADQSIIRAGEENTPFDKSTDSPATKPIFKPSTEIEGTYKTEQTTKFLALTTSDTTLNIQLNVTKVDEKEKVSLVTSVPEKKVSINETPKPTHKPKPTLTIGGPGKDKPIRIAPTTSTLDGMPRKIDYIVPIVITVIALPLLATIAVVMYRRGRDCWDKRHYRRMDFLIDGMYND